MGRYYCEDCHVWYEREELSELQEPHGEITLWCPESKQHDLTREDDYDPTPYETPEGGNFAEERYREAARIKRDLG